MAEYNQDRFILDIQAKELAQPERNSNTRVYVSSGATHERLLFNFN